MTEEKNDKSCSTKGCCCCSCGKKAFLGMLLALLVFGLGYCIGQGGLCKAGGMKYCPIMQSQQK